MQKTPPTFLGIGAQKAGTTWLYCYLNRHRQIWFPPQKELHFFDRSTKYSNQNGLATDSVLSRIVGSESWERIKTARRIHVLHRCLKSGSRKQFKQAIWWSKFLFSDYDESWYSNFFSGASSHQHRGEMTPAYSILDSEDIAQIKKINPDIKLIFLIRNPIDRAWSAIRYLKDRGYLDVKLDSSKEIIAALKQPRMILRGDYERTIDAYLEHFDSSQILVGFYDAIQNDPVTLMSEITTFLGVESFEEDCMKTKRYVNKSPQSQMPNRVRDYLLETYSPLINRLAMTFGSYASVWKTKLEFGDTNSVNQLGTAQLRPAFHP